MSNHLCIISNCKNYERTYVHQTFFTLSDNGRILLTETKNFYEPDIVNWNHIGQFFIIIIFFSIT